MSAVADLARICNVVKRKITPYPNLKKTVQARAEQIRAAVERESIQAGLIAEVRIDGSVAKDTWLRDDADVDIFMRVSPKLTKEDLRDLCLPIVRRALAPNTTVERYADHPYVESVVRLGKGRNLRVNVVPCYRVQRGEWLSATDRSPYHTEYVQQHLSLEQRDEVRLLKAFMKGIGAYGADIKTGGFSGMLCETLIASQGNFQTVVKEFSRWDQAGFIDVERYYEARRTEVRRLFREPLIVIDPVDKGRNLAAAVRSEQLWNFVAASRQLIAKPAASFFRAQKVNPLTAQEFRKLAQRRGSTIIAIVIGRLGVVVDILWSQLYRTERALITLLEENGFTVTKSASWSDEKALNVILLELEQSILPSNQIHVGPPVSKAPESASFLTKHLRNEETISGPWIERDRWVIERRREVTSAVELLHKALRSGGTSVGVASEPARNFRRKVEILSGTSIARLLTTNPDFAKAMRAFLSGRPSWLE